MFLEKHGIDYIFRLPSHVYADEISKMTSFDEILKFKNTTSRRKNIKDENIIK